MTSIPRKTRVRRASLVVAFSLVLLHGCGGGGANNGASGDAAGTGPESPMPGPTVVSTTLQGVAATGAPISLGTLTLLDAKGQTRSAAVGADGGYFIDMAGLARPMLVRVEGVSGGSSVIQYSAITPDVGGVLNANPVTTAIVTLAMGADPGVVFQNVDLAAVARLTDRAVGNASIAVHATLDPVRPAVAMSTTAGVDFLTGAFVADKTGLDRMLDLVKVRAEPGGSVTVANKTADAVVRIDPPPTADGVPTSSGSLGTVESIDTAGIDTLGARFQQQLANVAGNFGSSGTQAANDLFDASFLDGGENRDAVFGYLAGDTSMNGAELLPAHVLNCTGSAPNYVCDVKFTMKYVDGALESIGLPVRRQADASWRFYGNQAPLPVSVNPVNFRIVSAGGTTTRAGFNVNVEPVAPVAKAEVYIGGAVRGGPAAILYAAGNGNSCAVSYMVTAINGDCGNFVGLSDAQIDALKLYARPKITLRFLDGSNAQVGQPYTTYLETVPLKPVEVTDDRFAVFTEQSWSAFRAAGTDGTFTLVLSKSASVGLEDVTNVYPANASSGSHMPYAIVRTGTTFSVKKVGSAITMIAVTRDAAGRAFWFQRY